MKSGLLPHVRRLKIYYGHSKRRKNYTKHPVIRFGGTYLDTLNFKIGEQIEVMIHKDAIIIKKVTA